MYQTATITSKRQLTIPAEMYRKMNFEKRQKVILSLEVDAIRIESAVDLVDRLAGSLSVPPSYRGKNVDAMIIEAKRVHLQKRAKAGTGRYLPKRSL
ncbi:MAG: AbrB/MazE/SpoVT family DNA-binding domain-containing protein [Patescibacteria group bacterium]